MALIFKKTFKEIPVDLAPPVITDKYLHEHYIYVGASSITHLLTAGGSKHYGSKELFYLWGYFKILK